MARTSLVPQQPVFLSEADNKQLAEMDRQREAFNAAVEKYNQGMMGPGGYNEQLNAYIARLKEIEASGEEVPLPTAPTKMDVPVAPFTEESFVQAQEAAQARAQEAAGQRALAIQAFEDPSRFNLAGFAGLGSRTFAKGGEVKEEGTKASRMMKELGLSKPPKEKTLADEPSKQTPESLAYSLRAQAEGNRDKDLRRGSFSVPGALNVKRFEAGGEARSGEGFSPIAGSMGMPGAPEHERMRADTLGFIKRMDDASVMATASRMTGMPFESPTQARLMLEQLLGGGVSVSAGVMGIGQGMPERVVGYDVGAKFPALGGQMSMGATVPRGAGKPSFNMGYRKEFKDGGEVASNDAFITKHQAGGPVSKGRRPVREAPPRAPQLDSEYTFGSEDAFEFTPAGTRNRLMKLVRSSAPPGSNSKLFSDPQITRSREEFDQLARASKQPPLPSDAVGMFDAFVGPRGAMYVSPLGGSATLTHEAAHAADYNLKGLYRQAIESKERKSNPAAQQFVDAYEKLVGGKEYFGSQESRKKGAKTFDAKWVEENKDYRSHTPELAAFAMENAMGGDRGQMSTDRAPLHMDPTLATEFTILTDLAQKYVDSRANPVRRAEGSPEEGETADDPFRSGKPLRPRTRKPATQEENEALSRAVLQGMANMPYNIAGIPGDLANLLAAPTGSQPFYGSESAKALATQLGIRPAPPTDPAAAALYGAADIGSSLINPAGPVRAAARGAERAGAALSGAAKDFQEYNRILDVPGASYAVKPRGGQWLAGSPKESLVEAFGSYDLVSRGFPRGRGNRPLEEVQAEMRRTYPPEALAGMSEETQRFVGRSMGELENRIAIKRWIDGNLTNYIKNDLGTPDDPLRKLGEQGITHLPKSDIESGLWLSDYVVDTRKAQGFPEAGFSPGRDESRAWENLADEAIFVSKPSELRARARQLNPWVEKLQDPNTPLYTLGSQGFRQLGFDHVVDVLAEDLSAGRLRPNQLNKMSVEQAVRRTHEYDEEMRIAMEKAQAAKREGFPVYKTYPETNYRWIKLDKPGSFALESDAMGHSVRGYEPPKGHPDWVPESGESGRESYGHGGWNAIKSGRAQVYSLVDEKGQPHATIEMRAPIPGLAEEGPVITQIKGKQNSAPKDEYLPYVQDFVRSGEYPVVGDFNNTGFRFEAMEIFDVDQIARLQASGVKVPRYMTGQDAQQLSDILYRIDTGNDPATGMPNNFAKGGPVNKHDAFIKAHA